MVWAHNGKKNPPFRPSRTKTWLQQLNIATSFSDNKNAIIVWEPRKQLNLAKSLIVRFKPWKFILSHYIAPSCVLDSEKSLGAIKYNIMMYGNQSVCVYSAWHFSETLGVIRENIKGENRWNESEIS